jgi:hydroxymethylglutaryl-CoA lyase
MPFPRKVRIVEIGPRDGLQDAAAIVPGEVRLELIRRLADAGLTSIETTAAHPKLMEQLERPGIRYLVPVRDLAGFEAALTAGAKEVSVFGTASEAYAQRNIGCSISESLCRFQDVLDAAQASGVRVRAYVCCAMGCPHEGAIAPELVAEVAVHLFEMGCYEIALADTSGVGTPDKVQSVFRSVAEYVPLGCLAGYFHDTRGAALDNIQAAMQLGVGVFDSAVAGLGGGSGAARNVATEDLVRVLEGMGVDTGIDLAALIRAGDFICKALGMQTRPRAVQAWSGKCNTLAA